MNPFYRGLKGSSQIVNVYEIEGYDRRDAMETKISRPTELVKEFEKIIDNSQSTPSGLELNRVLARAWLRKKQTKIGASYVDEALVLTLAEFLTDYLRLSEK